MELHWLLVGAVDVLKRRKGESIPRFIFVPEWRTADDVVRCRSHASNIGKKNSSHRPYLVIHAVFLVCFVVFIR